MENYDGKGSKRAVYDDSIRRRKRHDIAEIRHDHMNQTTEEQEIAIRKTEVYSVIDSWHSVFSSLKVIFVFLLTKETYVPMLLAMGSTCYFYFLHRDNDDWSGSGIPFVLLGVAVVIPTINLITMEYTRRETALRRWGELRAVWLRLFQLHCFMDWNGGKGRQSGPNGTDPLGLTHADLVADNIMGACDELMRFLTLPSATQTHNYLTTKGRIRATHILSVAEPLFESCTARRATRFTTLAERLKAAGCSQTEMSRVEQFHKDMQSQYEHLRFVKIYRTPQALRSLARITTIMMLPLFGPSYAQLAINIDSLFFGLMLTAITALVLSGLYEAARVVEDPFTAYVVMDGINAREEMDTLHRQLLAIREEAFGQEAFDKPYHVPHSRAMTTSNLYDYFDVVQHEKEAALIAAAEREAEERKCNEDDDDMVINDHSVAYPRPECEPVTGIDADINAEGELLDDEGRYSRSLALRIGEASGGVQDASHHSNHSGHHPGSARSVVPNNNNNNNNNRKPALRRSSHFILGRTTLQHGKHGGENHATFLRERRSIVFLMIALIIIGVIVYFTVSVFAGKAGPSSEFKDEDDDTTRFF